LVNTALARRAELLEAERDTRARLAVTEERARIARELHDIIAHSVSVMVVQAGAAEQVVERDPGQAATALRAIGTTGRDALIDLRRLLGLLRRDEMPAALAPRPGLADLPALADQVRAAGLPVSVSVPSDAVTLPAGVDLTAFRVIQEALTNSLKHAGEASAAVTVRYAPEALEITVSDTGAGVASVAGEPGHGLAGMRERVSLYGGQLDAGPAPSGGFRVSARLPLGGAA
jgi:signal transduction histidine kinase